MDSGNSGSLQSSSGGDEEYDSRAADSVSAFFSGGPVSNSAPLPPVPFFDPLSNYLHLHQNPNPSIFDSGPTWHKASTGSGPNPVTQDNIMNSMLPSSSSFMPPASAGMDSSSGASALATPFKNQNLRNPKKRSRASRRAPTTVLTTDTTNFRAMVQEFTGIPDPPFSNSSCFPRSRLDFFCTRSTSFDAAQPPPYLRRPLPHKLQPQHSLLSSAALDAIIACSPTSNTATTTSQHVTLTTTAAAAAAVVASGSTPSVNYQLPITQNSNLFNIQNPLYPKFPFSNSPVISSKPSNSFQFPSNINTHAEKFTLGHGNHVSETLTGLPNLIHSDHTLRNDQSDDTENNNAARWNDSHVSGDGNKDDGVNLRSTNGGYNFPRNTTNSRMNFPATSTLSFQGGKAPENVAGRGEGMVPESWICSSE